VSAGAGAVAGLLVASVIGWAIYRGGMRLNLARFFRLTSLLLVIIAAGLVASALRHANEAGLITVLQGQALDLSAVITPDSGSVVNGLITGLLGIYPFPTYMEVVGWLAYAVPMFLLLLWPVRPQPVRQSASSADSPPSRRASSDGDAGVQPTPSS
jgi:high-affinity iron transporter